MRSCLEVGEFLVMFPAPRAYFTFHSSIGEDNACKATALQEFLSNSDGFSAVSKIVFCRVLIILDECIP